MPDETLPAREARRLFLGRSFGVLSTFSQEVEGYPHGSLTPYCLDYEENPIILVSDIAQHTRNIRTNHRVSLTIFAPGSRDVQASPRLTLMADAIGIKEEESEVRERYTRYFPDSATFFEAHDFVFYRLSPVRSQFIGGFGKVHWIDNDELFYLNPFSVDEEEYIIRHMNEDHSEIMRTYCNYYKKMALPDSTPVIMIGVDGDGFDLLVDQEKVRFDFKSQVSDSDEARAQLVAMAKDAI